MVKKAVMTKKPLKVRTNISHYTLLQKLDRLYNEVEHMEMQARELVSDRPVALALSRALDAFSRAQDLLNKEVDRRRYLRENYTRALQAKAR